MPSELRVDKVSSTTSPYDPVFSTTGGALSHRNMIINGDFQVWQRSESATSYNAFATADRWKHLTAGQVEKTTDNSANRNHVLKFTTSNSQSVNYIRQKVEAPADLDLMGKTLTLSFWMKTSEVLTTRVDFWLPDSSGNYAIYGFHNGSSTGSGSNSLALVENTSTSWNKHTVQVYIPNYTPKTDNTDALEVNIGVANGTATGKEVYIDQVQLERGTVATPFEHRSYGDELQRCQRYYYVNDSVDCCTYYPGSGNAPTENFQHPVQMRAAPSISLTRQSSDGSANSVTIRNITKSAFNLYWSGSGAAMHSFGHNGNPATYVAVSEL